MIMNFFKLATVILLILSFSFTPDTFGQVDNESKLEIREKKRQSVSREEIEKCNIEIKKKCGNEIEDVKRQQKCLSQNLAQLSQICQNLVGSELERRRPVLLPKSARENTE